MKCNTLDINSPVPSCGADHLSIRVQIITLLSSFYEFTRCLNPTSRFISFSLHSCIKIQRGDHRLQANHTQGGCATKHEGVCKVHIFNYLQKSADTSSDCGHPKCHRSFIKKDCYLGNATYAVFLY